jgi:uncharacterized protein (DUF4415 family)
METHTMQKSEHIVRYTMAELDEKAARGEDQTNWAYVDALTEEELEASIDWEDEGRFEWSEPYVHRFPAVIRTTTVRLDDAIVSWLNGRGGDRLTRIRFALRDFVDAQHLKVASEPRHRQRAGSESGAGIR